MVGISVMASLALLLATRTSVPLPPQKPLPFAAEEFGQIVASYDSGTLKEIDGVVNLPPSAAPCTADGRVYITQHPSGGTLFLFVTWRGKGSNLRGYLFSRQWSQNPQTTPRHGLEVNGPTVSSAARPQTLAVELRDTGAPGWCEASRTMD